MFIFCSTMAHLLTLCTMLACVVIYLTYRCDASILQRCAQCKGAECEDVNPADCAHGPVTDICGRRVCAKGPGMRCGGFGNSMGTCGRGLECRCERCYGCSTVSLKCDWNKSVCLEQY
ncbi:hypothetical protein J6590_064610 [Homalodisca vitripennis]|nr:hypothetical protein J6590_064610 [Homalodisca vitripennis]